MRLLNESELLAVAGGADKDADVDVGACHSSAPEDGVGDVSPPLEPTDLSVGSEEYRAFVVAAAEVRAAATCGADNVIDVPVEFHENGRLKSIKIMCKQALAID